MGGILKNAGAALGFGTSTSGVNGAGQMSEDEAYRQIQILKAQEANQRAFGDQLYNQAAGKAPSFAEAQMRQSQDRNLAQAMAFAKSNRSANAGLQSRNVQMNAAAQAQQTNQNAAMARMQEQQQNQTQYGNYLGGMQNNVHGLLGINNSAQKNAFEANAANDKTMREGAGQAYGMVSSGGTSIVNMFNKKPPGGEAMGTTETGMGNGGGASGGAGMMQNAAMGGMMMAFKGAKVPGRATVEGDSPLNDTVTAKVSPGEVIVPRTVVEKGPNAVAKFAEALSSRETHKKSLTGFDAVVAAQTDLNSKIKQLKSRYGK